MQLSVSGLSQRYGRWGENLWFASLIFLLLPVYLGFYNTAAIPALKIGLLALSFTAYLLLALKIYILDGHSKKELLLYSLVLALITLGVVFSGTRSLFSVFLLALGAKDVPFSKIAKVCLGFFAGVLVLNGILVLTGVLEDTLVIRGEAWGYGNVRHTLGFGYPNTLALWFMLAVFALLLRPKKGVYPWLPALALSLAAFALTDSKAAFFSSLLALLLWAVLYRLPMKGKAAGLTATGLLALIALIYTLLSLLYTPDSRILELCNTLLSQRLGYSAQGLRTFGVSLFGAHVDFGWDPVDSLYTYGPICLGLIPSFLYFALALWSTYRAASRGKWEIAAVAIAAGLYCTMEYSLINPVLCTVFAACARLDDGKSETQNV